MNINKAIKNPCPKVRANRYTGLMTLGLAVVGAGYWGGKLAAAIQRTPGLNQTWMVDPAQNPAGLLGGSSDSIRFSSEVAGAMLDSDTAAVVIAAPAGSHYSLAKLALQNEKHVFVEKPITLSSQEAGELVELARTYSRVLMVGHTFLFNQAVLDAKQILHNGQLGSLHHMKFSRTNLGPIRTDAGVLWDLGSHDLAIACWLLDSFPSSVAAAGASWVTPGVLDAATIWLDFDSSTSCQIDVTWLSPERVRKFYLIGSEAMVTVDDTNQTFPIAIHSKRARRREIVVGNFQSLETVDEGVHTPDFNWSEPLVNELSEFRDSIVEERQPRSNGEFGNSIVRILEASERSLIAGGAKIDISW